MTKCYGQPHSIPMTSPSVASPHRGQPYSYSWIMDLLSFFASLSSHLEQLQRHYFTDDLGLTERLVERSEECAKNDSQSSTRASQQSTSAWNSCLCFGWCVHSVVWVHGTLWGLLWKENWSTITDRCPVQQLGSVWCFYHIVDEHQIEARIELGCNYNYRSGYKTEFSLCNNFFVSNFP